MPTQAHDPPEQPAGVQATIGQNQHGPVARHGRAHHAQHAQPLAAPPSLFAGRQDRPGYGDAAAAIDHADGQNYELIAQAARIEREGDLFAGPEPNNPPQQRHKADCDIETGAIETGRKKACEVLGIPYEEPKDGPVTTRRRGEITEQRKVVFGDGGPVQVFSVVAGSATRYELVVGDEVKANEPATRSTWREVKAGLIQQASKLIAATA